MAASSDSESKKSRREDLGGKDEKSDAGVGSMELALVPSGAAGGTNGAAAVPSGAPPAAAGGAAAVGVAGKERDYIWTEDAVHVLLDHFLEKYMSYEKGMIRNADWVEIAQRVNQQLDGNKPVKTPEQCKNKVDNLKKQYRKERRRGSLGPTSTNWAFFSRMHDIFESDYKKTGGAAEPPAAVSSAQPPGSDEPPAVPSGNNNASEDHHGRMRSGAAGVTGGMQPDHHYLASREFLRKQQQQQQQHEELMQYKRGGGSRRSETPPPPAVPPQHHPLPGSSHYPIHQLMLMPESMNHHHRDSGGPARKKSKSDRHHHHHEVPHAVPQRHHHAPPAPHGAGEGSAGPPSSDSGGAPPVGVGVGEGVGSSKHDRKLHRHQLAALRRDFMEGFTGFAEVMLKIEVAKMEMQRDLERQRAEMELHRTQMMLSNQLQLAKYLKSSPLSAVPHGGPPEGGFWPNFGFTDGGGGGAAAGGTPRMQLAIPIFPDFTALDAVGPYEVLHLLPNVEVLFVSHQPGLYAAGMGMLTLQATASFDQVPRPQILVVPGGMGTRRLLQDRVILDWIRKVHEHTLYTASVCTGSLLLGAAGLLKGIEATTHWNSHELLAEFGAKPVSSRIVRQGKIITAAGVSAGIDMALQLAALLSDEATAKTLQLYIEYDPQPPFDSGSVIKAGPEVVSRAKELSSKRIAQLQGGGRGPA